MEYRRGRPTKRALADHLIRRLWTRFAPGGLLHSSSFDGGIAIIWRGSKAPAHSETGYSGHIAQWRNADLVSA
jgi:uncharacterized protein (DUF2126 family)